jgi:hypothetical protein
VEVVTTDSSISISYAKVDEWNFEGVECFSKQVYEGDIIKVFGDGQQPIQTVGSKSFD